MSHQVTVVDALTEFLKGRLIQEKLAMFYKENGRGFEKWFQFELMYFLKGKEYDVDLEKAVVVDPTLTAKTKYQVDVLVRNKGESLNHRHAIELKVTKGSTGAIKRAIGDLMRLANSDMRLANSDGSCLKYRSVTAVAICENAKGNGKFKQLFERLQAKKKQSWIVKEVPIGKTEMSVYLIGWKVAPRKAEKEGLESFKRFCQEVRDLAKELGIELRA